ncbi:uncharacterized protein BO95DRAFT_437538 [Aspergillus brunneoviolaceus CBS 621.78]|uniref:Uncharacterized protein n=1 Tax=Aspergillus brunneoviolaceus CBS 621.78 TaxID=1450534 RepID=A0ACD1GQ44_9EURO|nr:hypothetical protein BO95DRAFT_437538 [Aspergillus brunneoviolaceus CBS 621.78]RAH51381.1 hypothetical protein BO95DRAFT_437538 [Aspergillus brunneoviolaceus CBS 621.78]
MRPIILLHPQLRAALPRSVRRSLNSKLFARLKTTENAARSPKNDPFIKRPAHPESMFYNKEPDPASYAYGKLFARKGPPEVILIYNGGVHKAMFLAALKITGILLYGVTIAFILPEFMSGEYPDWYAPAALTLGAIPMLFMAYNGATFVCYIHLFLPMSARQSRQAAEDYARNLPPTARLFITTMAFSTRPIKREVHLKNLVPEVTLRRPVSFKDVGPESKKGYWTRGLTEFWAAPKSHRGKQSTAFYPHLWPVVREQIERRAP